MSYLHAPKKLPNPLTRPKIAAINAPNIAPCPPDLPLAARARAPCSLAHTLRAYAHTRAYAHMRTIIYMLSLFCILSYLCVSLSICISARPPSSNPSLNDVSPLMQGVWLRRVAEAGAGADCLVVRGDCVLSLADCAGSHSAGRCAVAAAARLA